MHNVGFNIAPESEVSGCFGVLSVTGIMSRVRGTVKRKVGGRVFSEAPCWQIREITAAEGVCESELAPDDLGGTMRNALLHHGVGCVFLASPNSHRPLLGDSYAKERMFFKLLVAAAREVQVRRLGTWRLMSNSLSAGHFTQNGSIMPALFADLR